MYRCLILLVIVGFAHSHYHGVGSSCPWRHSRWCHLRTPKIFDDTPTKIEEIKNNFINAELALQKYCKENTNILATELYGTDRYFLKYRTTETSNEEFRVKVQITHRIVHTLVKSTNGSRILEDVRLLPDTVQTNQATYSITSSGIDISVPYKVSQGTIGDKKCGDVNSNVIEVSNVVYPVMTLRSKPDSSEVEPSHNIVY